MLFLVKITFDGEIREIELEKPELVVGRSTPVEEVDVDLNPDAMVSRKHIILKMEYNMGTAKNEAWIHDQGSSRGTLLNGKPVTDPVKIDKDDVISIGQSELRVRLLKKPKHKSKMSFQEKVEARSKSFGAEKSKRKPKDKMPRDKLSGLPIMVEPDPPPAEEPPPPPAEETPISSHDETSPGVTAALLTGACQTESAGFVAYSIEDLAHAVNRYAREQGLQAISASVVQEDKGTRASFRALVVFINSTST